ncbi:hypothetical protein H8958_015703 [Nasalis larvatus]
MAIPAAVVIPKSIKQEKILAKSKRVNISTNFLQLHFAHLALLINQNTISCKVTGSCGSVLVHLIPAPRDTGVVSAPVPKKLFMMAGIDDCYTSARGCTATLGNFAEATFDAISKTYSYLTPDLWKETVFTKSPYQEFTDHLVNTHTRVSVQRTQTPAVATT